MSKVRLGMVGGGPGAFIGNIHRMAAALDGEFELVCGAFSRAADQSQLAGQQLGLDINRVYASYAEMFEHEQQLPAAQRMECVAIVTPNHLHFSVAKMALASGFNVMCEKPVTSNLVDAITLKKLVADSGKIFGVAHTYLGYPLIVEARSIVKQGLIGAIKKVVVEYSQGWLADINSSGGSKQADWRLDPTQTGASCCMGDIGSHAVNLSEFITGAKVSSVLADLGSVVAGRTLDDDAGVLLRYDNNARGVLIASQISIGEENNLTIKIYGDKGSLKWSQQEPNTLWFYDGHKPAQMLRAGQPYLSEEAQSLTRTPAGHPEGYIEAFANLYKQFAQAVRMQRENENITTGSLCTIDDAVHGMAVIDAVVKSSMNGNVWTSIQNSADK